MFKYLKKFKRFDENTVKFYLSEVILGLEYLHSKNIIYRDLKPENIVLDEVGHISLTDFGLAKVMKNTKFTSSFVGTPEYNAPEMLKTVANYDGKLTDY